jgi:hypothetical protein
MKLYVLTSVALLSASACGGGEDGAAANGGSDSPVMSSSGTQPATTPPASAGTRAGTTPTTGSAGTAAPATAGTPAQAAAGATASAAGGGAVGAVGGASGDDAGTGKPETPTCKPSTWMDPGTVPDPKIVKVEASAGKGTPWGFTEDVKKYDYVEEEFFFSGTSPMAYTSRMLVRRPRDPAKFTGTVFVEWYNVSGQEDFDPLWMYSWEYFMRQGHVEISVTAQKTGADSLAVTDPERYADINQPDDTISDAIFSQAGMAIRSQAEQILGPCMPVEAMIGMGQSQSSFRISQYIDNTAKKDKIYDGYITQSGSEPVSNDTGFPTFVVMTMTEGNGSLMEGPNLVKWVLAGATHFDKFMLGRAAAQSGEIGMSVDLETVCAEPLNTYPSERTYYAVNDWMHRWLRNGERPPSAMPLGGNRLAYQTDEHGNVTGGVRLPEVDVPTATYTPDNAASDPFNVAGFACSIGGVTEPFTPQKLLQLYPTHEDYVTKYKAAAEKAVAGGFLLEQDSKAAIEAAEKAPIPH